MTKVHWSSETIFGRASNTRSFSKLANRFGLVNSDDFLAAPQTWESCFEGGWAVLSHGGRAVIRGEGLQLCPAWQLGGLETNRRGRLYIGQGVNQGYALYDFRGY